MTLFATFRKVPRRVAPGAVLATTMLLAACSGNPSKDDLADGLNAWIGQAPVCWSIANSASANFPLHASLPADRINAPAQPILDGLMRGGYITLGRSASRGFAPSSALDIALTDKGEDAKVWDPDHGFCVGTKAVDEVKGFTDPTGDPRTTTHVTYTWHLVNVPDWADPKLFASVPGLGKPVAADAVMRKTDHGWQVE